MTNQEFQSAVIEACERYLKDGIDAKHYANAVLDELFDGEGYGDCYYEIRGFHTKSGQPVVIS